MVPGSPGLSVDADGRLTGRNRCLCSCRRPRPRVLASCTFLRATSGTTWCRAGCSAWSSPTPRRPNGRCGCPRGVLMPAGTARLVLRRACAIAARSCRTTPTVTPQDPALPAKWLSELFDKYLPATILEMKRSFSHITPLSTMNFVTVGRGRGRCACLVRHARHTCMLPPPSAGARPAAGSWLHQSPALHHMHTHTHTHHRTRLASVTAHRRSSTSWRACSSQTT
jgi:hypothetical protein